MIISRSRGFVVFAPWKTASQTLHARLAAYNESPYSRFFEFNTHLNRVVHQHLTCADFAALPEARLGLFAASFVRHPYDRAWSGFRQLQHDIQTQGRADFPQPWIRSLVMRQLEENRRQLDAAGHDFDAWLASVREDQIYDSGRNTNFPLHPAHYWTHLGGAQWVDFIGRVETFEADFGCLLERLGLEPTDPVNENVRTPPIAQASPTYAARMSRASLDKINRLFEADFATFGYRTL